MTFRHARLLALAWVVLAGCELDNPYFTEPDRMYATAVAALGEARYVGVAFLAGREGDTVELVSAEPIEPVGIGPVGISNDVIWHALPLPVPGADASIGVVDETWAGIGSLVPMEGASVPYAEDPSVQTEVVVEIRSLESGRVSFEAVRIVFTVDGRPRSQVIPMGVAVCFDDPAPESCDAGGG